MCFCEGTCNCAMSVEEQREEHWENEIFQKWTKSFMQKFLKPEVYSAFLMGEDYAFSEGIKSEYEIYDITAEATAFWGAVRRKTTRANRLIDAIFGDREDG